MVPSPLQNKLANFSREIDKHRPYYVDEIDAFIYDVFSAGR